MSDDIKYEYKSVQAVRGMEKRSIAKVQQKDGWELVDQTHGTLRTTLNFRRVKPEAFQSKAWDAFRALAPAKQLALAAAAAVLLVIAVVGIGIADRDSGDANTGNTATNSTEPEPVTQTPLPSATPTPSEETDPVITAANNKEFAALLKAGDYCDLSMGKFATKYEGQKIEFDGSIAYMQNHEDYDTRYDILLGPGDAGTNTTVGPAFKYDNVSMLDLNFTGANTPSYVSEGDKLRFTAEVGEYNPDQCLFFLAPDATAVR